MPYHDANIETLPPDELMALQRTRLRAMLDAVIPANRFYQAKLQAAGVDAVTAELTDLPFTTRAELQQDQAAHPPYGSNVTYPLRDYVRLHQTSGSMGAPLRWLDRTADWDWWRTCWATIYRAAGITDNDIFIFPFSFGPFIGFWAAFESAVALGNLCLPAGGMTTTARLRFMLDNNVTIIGCTPTYALRMAEVAAAEGVNIADSAVRGLVVAGEPGGNIPATRAAIENAWGARLFDHSGMTEMGAYGFECVERTGGLHVNEAAFIPEVRDPQTGAVSREGEGELILTNLGRWGMPLIRYATGDHVRLEHGKCACGRHYAWLDGGIVGRIDDMIVVRGNNVFPSAIEAILRGCAGVAEFRLEIDERDALTQLNIEIEPVPESDANLVRQSVGDAIRDRLNFKPGIRTVEPGTLPRFEMKARRVVRRTAD